MKRLAIIAFTACLLAVTLTAAPDRGVDKLRFPELNDFSLPPIQKAELANGLRLRVVRTNKLPLVDIRILVDGGSVYDPADKVGRANITANLMRIGGTEKWTGDELDLFLDRRGIELNVQAADDYFVVTLSCLAADLEPAVTALAQVLRTPRFAKDKLEEIRTRLSSSIARRNDEPNGIAAREFDRVIYGKDSPFAPVLEYAHLAAIQRADVEACHQSFFAPANMLAGVAGPVDLEEVKTLFQRHFGDWTHQADIPAYPQAEAPNSRARVFLVEKSNLNQSTIHIGHMGTRRDLEAEPAQMVFNAIFSQGMNSRLFQRVRTKMGLTYGVGGGIETEERHPGKTAFFTFTKSTTTLKAIRAVLEEVDKIRSEAVTPRELADAKDYYINSFVFRYSSPEKILRNELRREFYHHPEGYARNLLEAIKAVTAADVLATAQKYVKPGDFRILIVGNPADFDGRPSELGPVEKVNITIPPPPVEETIPEATPESLARGAAVMGKAFDTLYKGYRSLKTLKTQADMKMTMPQGTFDMTLENLARYPDKRYTVMGIMGMKIETVINGDKGVMRQMGQTRPLPEDRIAAGRFASLYHMANHPEAYRFQALADKVEKGVTYQVIYVTPADGGDRWKKLFFNGDTGYLEMEEQISQMPGNPGVARETNSDFRIVSGIPFAFRSVTRVKDKVVADVTVKQVVVNGPVDENRFKIE